MAHTLPDQPPAHAYDAVRFAESIAREYTARGIEANDLFAAFVGLVSASDKDVAARCLIALDEGLQIGACDRGAKPTA